MVFAWWAECWDCGREFKVIRSFGHRQPRVGEVQCPNPECRSTRVGCAAAPEVIK